MTLKEVRTERDAGKYVVRDMVMRYLARVSEKVMQGV